jgi:hypothetical protein
MSVPVKSPELQKKAQGRSPLKADRTPARGKSSKSVRKGMNEKQRLITAASRKKDLVSDDSADVGKNIV